jgi:translocation and assembly module TamB
LLSYIALQGVTITLGEDVFLRSRGTALDEASIKLVGTLAVTRGFRRAREFGAIEEEFVPALLFDGVLRAERGTYSLALDPSGFLFKKEFQVENGTVTFQSGGAEQLIDLNISALHTVRTSSGDDIRVRARLLGDPDAPRVVLESGESFAISQSDLVSYLIFGQPNFNLGAANQNYIQLVAQTITPSAGALVRGVARRFLGSSVADALRVETAVDWSTLTTDQRFSREFFSRSRVGYETRVGESNVFVSVSTPLFCGEDQDAQSSYFIEGLSAKIDWRLSRDAAIQAGREPSALVCSRGSSGRVVATPAQWGISVLRSWRF